MILGNKQDILIKISFGKSSSGTSGPTQSAAANNFFKENRDSIINDPNPTKFIDPQTFIQKYGDGQVIQDPNQGFA